MSENVKATLVWTRQDGPHVLAGSVIGNEAETYRFRPEAGVRPDPGERLILCLDTPDHQKLKAQAMESEGEDLVIRAGKDQPILRRYYPRADTALALVYRVIDLGGSGANFSKRETAVMKSWWRPATQEVNLSVDGLAFSSMLAVPAGARLNVKLTLPDKPTVDHSVVGDVVRAVPETLPDGEEGYRLAVQLNYMSPETHEALLDYLRLWQDEALEALEPAAPPQG